MRWLLIIIPITAFAANSDETVSAIGFVILSIATIIYRANKFMNNDIDTIGEILIDQWLAKALTFVGGTVAVATPFQVIGAVCSIIGVVFLFLNYRINSKRLKIQIEQHEADK